MNLNDRERLVVKNLVNDLRKVVKPLDIFLYGSAAREQLTEGSDIDLFLVLSEVSWEIEKQISDLCFSAELECGRVISSVCFTEDEIKNTALRSSPLVLRVASEGVRL